MKWSDKEEEALMLCQQRGGGWPQIAALAVELAAARGGTMTEERVREYIKEGSDLGEHLATLGARIAVLEADVAKARQSEDVWRKRLEAAAVALGAHGAGQVGRLDIVARVRILLDNTAQSRQREECIRRRSLEAGNLERLIAEHGLPAAMRWVVDREEPQELMDPTPDRCAPCLCIGYDHPHRLFGAIWRCSNCGEIGRWPCSPTCTHDDAITPGHPERMKERSEAVERATFRDGRDEGYTEGVEAMRAACLEAVQRVATIAGAHGLLPVFKAAIEGATP